ncbi:hypothetical protein K353_04688 [Kitasatospora sp. SolWspMP-SS2h]|nr:hypothetical protein K353_04688 [Kitasatospora sp. SolWspMP-SS2h]
MRIGEVGARAGPLLRTALPSARPPKRQFDLGPPRPRPRRTERRREEIRRIVQAMPARQRAGLVRAPRAFADAGAEPTAPSKRPEPLGW